MSCINKISADPLAEIFRFIPNDPQVSAVCKSWNSAYGKARPRVDYDQKLAKVRFFQALANAQGKRGDSNVNLALFPGLRDYLAKHPLPSVIPPNEIDDLLKTWRQQLRDTDNVWSLDLSSKNLAILPKEIDLFPNLTELDLSNNELREISSTGIGALEKLRFLNLSNNRLESLPSSLVDRAPCPGPEISISNSGLKQPPSAFIRQALLVATTVCSILATIPPIRRIGSLCLRSVALISSGFICQQKWNQENILGRITTCTKIAIVAVGLIAASTNSFFLVTGAIMGDAALQLINATNALHKGDQVKALWCLVDCIYNSLLGVAFLVESPIFVSVISLISTFIFVNLMVLSFLNGAFLGTGHFIETGCYLTLMGLGIANLILVAPQIKVDFIRADYSITNDSNDPLILRDRDGTEVGVIINPHETKTFSSDYRILFSNDNHYNHRRYVPDHIEWKETIISPGLPVEKLPTVPLGGTLIINDPEESIRPWKRYRKAPKKWGVSRSK